MKSRSIGNHARRWLFVTLLTGATGCHSVPKHAAIEDAMPMECPPVAACPPPLPEPPPLPYCPVDPCADPFVTEDEYLRDGGDHGLPVKLDEDWEVRGLETEDTVAYWDSVSGCCNVQPSNCVCIYAPRFGSVRQIVAPIINEQVAGPNGVEQPVELVRFDKRIEPTTTLQNIPIQAGIERRKAVELVADLAAMPFSNVVRLQAVQDALAPYEDFNVIRIGVYEQSEKPYLAKAEQAAVAWTLNQSVNVIVDNQAANEIVRDQGAEAVFTYEDIPGCPMLRVIKVASTQAAKPGETVDFTIRFDNLGTETARNVTIVDSLTTRLEYVPESAQASVDADFSTASNDAGSLVLRWQIKNPLRPGEGGIVRFSTKVR